MPLANRRSLPSCPASVLPLPLAPIHTSSPAPPSSVFLLPETPSQSLSSAPYSWFWLPVK